MGFSEAQETLSAAKIYEFSHWTNSYWTCHIPDTLVWGVSPLCTKGIILVFMELLVWGGDGEKISSKQIKYIIVSEKIITSLRKTSVISDLKNKAARHRLCGRGVPDTARSLYVWRVTEGQSECGRVSKNADSLGVSERGHKLWLEVNLFVSIREYHCSVLSQEVMWSNFIF